MNPYMMAGTGIGTSEASSLASRLAAWHDAMVAHARRLRSGQSACDGDCPHVEARALWTEAVAALGAGAQEFAFLRASAIAPIRGAARTRANHARPEL